MKRILIMALLVVLIAPAFALPDVYDQLRGRQMVGDAGAPWFADNAVMYFGTDKDASLKYNTATGYLEVVGTTVYDNTSIMLASGNDLTAAGGDSKLDMSAGTGVTKTTTGVFSNMASLSRFESAINNFYGAILAGGLTTTNTLAVNSTGLFGGQITAGGGLWIPSAQTTNIGTGAVKIGGAITSNEITENSTKTLAVTSADKLTVGTVIVPQYKYLEVPLDNRTGTEYIFFAGENWQVVSVNEIHRVKTSLTGNTVTLVKVPAGRVPAASVNVTASAFTMSSDADTSVTQTVSVISGVAKVNATDRLASVPSGGLPDLVGGVMEIVLKRI